MRIDMDRIQISPAAKNQRDLDAQKVTFLRSEAQAEGAFRHPIRVAPEGDVYRLVDGYHRFMAARALGWRAIEAEIQPAEPSILLAPSRGRRPPAKHVALTPSAPLSSLGDSAAPATPEVPGAWNPRRMRLLHEALRWLSEERHIEDGRLAQVFELGPPARARELRLERRGLAPLEPMGLHEMPLEFQLGIRELVRENLVGRDDLEAWFPLNDRERREHEAEKALGALMKDGAEPMKLKGSRWGPDYRTGAPARIKVIGVWDDGHEREFSLAEIPGVDRYTVGIIAKAFLADGNCSGPEPKREGAA
ncbi:MAG: ParB/RepB/Spo0J family partition protein [Thermoplasmatota archaeon]